MFYEENLISLDNYQKDELLWQDNERIYYRVIEKNTNKVLTAIIFTKNYDKNKQKMITKFYEQICYSQLNHISLLKFIG